MFGCVYHFCNFVEKEYNLTYEFHQEGTSSNYTRLGRPNPVSGSR